MILEKNGVFLLGTEKFSYLFRINAHGQPEQLHFGCPVQPEDAVALACKPGLGWGTSVNYDEADGTCLDVLPLEWSGSGRGDYRESPLELSGKGGSMATDFTYVNHKVQKGIVPMTCGLPQSTDGGETLELVLEHPGGLRLKLYYTVFDAVLTRRAVLENRGEAPIWIHKFMSFCLDLPGDFEMTTFDGGWIAENRKSRVHVGAARVVHDSTTGFSSNRHQPGFLLSEPGAGEDYGIVYGINLVYSGNYYASAQQSLQGLTRVMQGINPADFRIVLQPGGSFETPEAVLVWSDRGFNGMSARMHDYVNSHIVPKPWRRKTRPVLYNSWEGCSFDFTHNRLVELAKQAKSADEPQEDDAERDDN